MVVSRFMVMVAAAFLIVASLGFGPVAATTTYGPHAHCSSMDLPDHDDCEDAGNLDMGFQGCCQGMSCAPSGVLAQAAMAVPFMLLIGQPESNATDHLFGRSIVPETGPPKLLA